MGAGSGGPRRGPVSRRRLIPPAGRSVRRRLRRNRVQSLAVPGGLRAGHALSGPLAEGQTTAYAATVGLTQNSARFVLYVHSRGVSFRRTAMIGRQQLLLEPEALAGLLRRYGHEITDEAAAALLAEQEGFAEPLLRLIGADEVRSFDASSYEGATDVHDLNQPLPERYDSHFDFVLDSGSLEHVFDVRTALANCMNMVDNNGHLVAISPANNFFGHGFYQFSPEFFYRAFSEDNGFSVELLAMYEDVDDPHWYKVVDPKSLEHRLTLVNSRPTYLALLAKRISRARPLAAAPQESDYTDVWHDPAVDIAARTAERGLCPSTPRDHLKRRAEMPLKRLFVFQDDLRSRRRMKHLGLQSLEIP